MCHESSAHAVFGVVGVRTVDDVPAEEDHVARLGFDLDFAAWVFGGDLGEAVFLFVCVAGAKDRLDIGEGLIPIG